jgi:hypothetical protein
MYMMDVRFKENELIKIQWQSTSKTEAASSCTLILLPALARE